jgi:hypothetical protein
VSESFEYIHKLPKVKQSIILFIFLTISSVGVFIGSAINLTIKITKIIGNELLAGQIFSIVIKELFTLIIFYLSLIFGLFMFSLNFEFLRNKNKIFSEIKNKLIEFEF